MVKKTIPGKNNSLKKNQDGCNDEHKVGISITSEFQLLQHIFDK
jgi:hypothetical protein